MGHLMFDVRLPKPIGGCLGEIADAGFAFLEHLLGLFENRDVGANHANPRDDTLRITNREAIREMLDGIQKVDL